MSLPLKGEISGSLNFDDIFNGIKKPSFCLDTSYLTDIVDNNISEANNGANEYLIRKFSTTSGSSRIVEEETEISLTCIDDEENPPMYNVVFLGDHNTGKSSLIHQLRGSNKESVLGVELDGWKCCLLFEEGSFYPFPRDCSVKLFVVVFAIDDRNSMEKAGAILAMLRRDGVQGFLVGNKMDLVRCREVKEEEGRILGLRYGVEYLETCVGEGIEFNVETLLVELVREMRAMRKKVSITERLREMVGRKFSREQESDDKTRDRKHS